jgi:class 3 adenylate cyclase/predicted ATPase
MKDLQRSARAHHERAGLWLVKPGVRIQRYPTDCVGIPDGCEGESRSLCAWEVAGVNDVAAWLEALGLGKYSGAFQDHEVDFQALPHLTEQMLEKMGLPIGPRARLLAAISKLAPSPASGIPQRRDASVSAESPLPHQQGERRQMTVMFSDLVDSTKLATHLDPEDLKSLMQAYQRACGAVIERYDGHVAQYRGDGIEAYFGWPTAQEDAAERAVRAGLEIVEAVKKLESPSPLGVRVGISTGIVVISDTGRGDPSTPSGAVGDTPYAAARLQTLAIPNTVVIADTTSRLISARFRQKALGPQKLKGISEPIHAFQVRQVREYSSRFQATRAGTLTPLVDRRTELALLQQRWRDAKDGEGQMVYVSGVPGIGKSRIVHELEQSIGRERHFSLRFHCSPHHIQSAFFPIIQQFQRLARLNSDDGEHVKLDKLRRLLSKATERVDKAIPFIAEMVSNRLEPRYAPVGLTAVQVKVQTLFVLVELLLDLSTREPVFCLLEDAQWVDPSTQEVLDLLLRQIGRARILVLVTHRPEYHPRSEAYGNVSALTIPRLGRRDIAELAHLALRKQAVYMGVISRIIDESDSIPLFVEELARGVLESGAFDELGSPAERFDPPTSAVPDSLRDALVARLDRAPQARSVAQMAAVIGREFSDDILLRVSSLSRSELDSTLAHLEQSDIVQKIDNTPPARYVFKHALVRDAAYESLLKSSRREIHAKVAATLEKERPEVVTAQPELLAYHLSAAGNAEIATRYWLAGGQRARSRWAHVEATGQFQKALDLLALLPETDQRRNTELEIQLSLGLSFVAVRGYSAEQTRKSFERARILSAELGDPIKEIQALFGLWGHYWMRARHTEAIELGATLLAKAEQLSDPIARVVGHRSLGSTLFTLGEPVRAREHLERAISLAQEVDIEASALSYAVDPRIAAQLMLAWDLWILGYPEQALDNALGALGKATQRGEPYGVAFAHYVTSAVRLLRGEPQASLDHADRSLAVAQEHRINLYALYSRFGRGCALAAMGRAEQAIPEIRSGVDEAQRANLGYMRGFMLGWLAIVQAQTGDPERALSTIDEAFEHISDVAGRAWEAELRRLHAHILLVARAEATADAERLYKDAIAVAQRQCARSLELRATTSLARLLHGQHRSEEARTLLAPLYNGFTEGFDTADLREAKALLGELA